MTPDFSSIHNHNEREVFNRVLDMVPQYPKLTITNDLLCDVACVALNRLPARYIRHEVDFRFYLTDRDRVEIDAAVQEAVSYAFDFVEARTALKARTI
jgi:hypothetical protein